MFGHSFIIVMHLKKKQVFTPYIIHIHSQCRNWLQSETWFFGIIHCSFYCWQKNLQMLFRVHNFALPSQIQTSETTFLPRLIFCKIKSSHFSRERKLKHYLTLYFNFPVLPVVPRKRFGSADFDTMYNKKTSLQSKQKGSEGVGG